MATNKLSGKFCETAPVGTNFDGEGLYLLVKPDGKRYWHMACYLNGKRKLLSFGAFPKVSLEKARKARKSAQDLLEEGIDPVQHKKEKKHQHIKALQKAAQDQGNTFEQLAKRLHEHKKDKTSEEYRNRMLRQFEIHMFPLLGHKHIAEIENAELLSLFRNIAQRTNHGRPMTYMAKKLCQWTGEVFDLAHIENQDFNKNPCRVIVKYLPNHDTQHMARIRFEELSKFLQDLKHYKGYPLTKAAIWMLLYTGMRQASIRRALLRDFDLKNGIWYRQPEKTDKSILRVPLPQQAIQTIQDILPFTDQQPDALAFPSVTNPHHPMSEAAICQALDRMNYKMVGHGLRSVVSTGLNELGFRPHVIEAQLGHKKADKVEAAYNAVSYFDERREMMQKWGDYLTGLIKY